MSDRNRLGELPFQRSSDPQRERDARQQQDSTVGELVPGSNVPVVQQPATPGGPDSDATGCP